MIGSLAADVGQTGLEVVMRGTAIAVLKSDLVHFGYYLNRA
jgi:hypothetical protein